MPSPRDETFLRNVTWLLGQQALVKARPAIAKASNTLAAAAHEVRLNPNTVAVYIPHYWAVYVHEGRSPFSKPYLMCWFKDPNNDPRLSASGGKTPARVVNLRRLTKGEFSYWQHQNYLADPDGTHPERKPMIVTKVIYKGTPASKFFDNKVGMAGFPREAAQEMGRAFGVHVTKTLGKMLHQSDSATGTISWTSKPVKVP